jgi:maltose alpha-D-glucosyltransferase/alpha-amylase
LKIEATARAGLSDHYQVPVVILFNADADALVKKYPQALIAYIRIRGVNGILCDAWYTEKFRSWLFASFMGTAGRSGARALRFDRYHAIPAGRTRRAPDSFVNATPGQPHMGIVYENSTYLKVYRRIEAGVHPDFEMSFYLSNTGQFPSVPAIHGSIEWQAGKGKITLAMLQQLVENNGDGFQFMKERMINYVDRVIARKPGRSRQNHAFQIVPLSFDSLDEEAREMLGERGAKMVHLVGQRVGEFHRVIAASPDREFSMENFSMHYQRSLYAASHSILRETLNGLSGIANRLPGDLKRDAAKVLENKATLTARLKRIYEKKLDVTKMRVHGNLTLKHLLVTSRDIAIHNFQGDISRTFGERRLKRSPLRDVASMMHSIMHAGLEGFYGHAGVSSQGYRQLAREAEHWIGSMSAFFLDAYLATTAGNAFVPADKKELQLMLDAYLLEKALTALNQDLNKPGADPAITLKVLSFLL